MRMQRIMRGRRAARRSSNKSEKEAGRREPRIHAEEKGEESGAVEGGRGPEVKEKRKKNEMHGRAAELQPATGSS